MSSSPRYRLCLAVLMLADANDMFIQYMAVAQEQDNSVEGFAPVVVLLMESPVSISGGKPPAPLGFRAAMLAGCRPCRCRTLAVKEGWA